MSKPLSAAAQRLLARLKVDCINLDRRPSPAARAAIEELNAAGFFVQTENPLHEGWWITYYENKKDAR